MKNGFRASLVCALVGLLIAATPATAITYFGSVEDNGLTASYKIETDGTLGIISFENITKYTMRIFDSRGAIEYNEATPGANLTVSGLLATKDRLSLTRDTTGEIAGPVFGTGYNGMFVDWDGLTFIFIDDISYREGFKETDTLANVAAVPELATWTMMLVGFGGVGFAVRRRKSIASGKGACAV